MKTTLPTRINTVAEAQAFLKELYTNGESFHPEDDALNIDWDCDPRPTVDEQFRLNLLMEDIYNLSGNDGRHSGKMIFDPCTCLLELDPEYLQRVADDTEEVEDDRIFTAQDMVEFAIKVAKWWINTDQDHLMMADDLRAYAENEVRFEEGDQSYDDYILPTR